MRLEPTTPTPTPEQAEAVTRTRRLVDEARRQGRSRDVVLLAYAAYTLSCREAGALEPPPLAAWPTPTDPRPTGPGRPTPPEESR